MKLTIITTIVVLFILMGVSDALKDNGKKTFSKWIESIYLFILFFTPVLMVKYHVLSDISLIHYLLTLCMIRQTVVNISYGITRRGIDWSYIGTTSVLSDGGLNWLVNKALKTPQKHFLIWFYFLEFMVGVFVMYRNALIE